MRLTGRHFLNKHRHDVSTGRYSGRRRSGWITQRARLQVYHGNSTLFIRFVTNERLSHHESFPLMGGKNNIR